MTNTIATAQAKVDALFTSGKGAVVTICEKSLAQLKEIHDTAVSEYNYREEDLDQDDIEILIQALDGFSAENLSNGSEIIDNVLVPLADEKFASVIATIKKNSGLISRISIVPAILLTKACLRIKQFNLAE